MNQKELKCPKCGSTQLSSANKKSFSGVKAITGFLLTGDIGLFEKNSGFNKIEIICLACDHKFKPSEAKRL